MLLGAIADDLTGGTDLALTLSREGMVTVQVIGVPEAGAPLPDADAIVVSLKSRTSPVAEAVEESLASARALLDAGARQLFFKYCSTFDSTDEGNIGPVAEALMDLLGENLTIACPAFPANGRTVYKGHLFVGDLLLSDSSMKDHPLTPMRDASLVRVLQRQTSKPVGLVDHRAVSGGVAALETAFSGRSGMLVVDALTDDDLRAIGAAAQQLRLLTGGSGLAIGLPESFRRQGLLPERRSTGTAFAASKGRSVIFAGSCSTATRRQVDAAIEAGTPAMRLDALDIAAGTVTADDVVRFVTENDGRLAPLVYSSADPAIVAEVQRKLGRHEAGAIVERLLAKAAAALAGDGFRRFVVAGGETSGAVVASLGVNALRIGPEIAPGVPWTRSADSGLDISLALKSGNFGGDDFFLTAFETLA